MKIDTPIQTARLILKPQSMHDFERFFAMSKDPKVMAFIGDGQIFHWTRQVALARFREQLAATPADGLGPRAIYRKEDALYLGWCAVGHSSFLNHTELGYRLCSDVWGNGYATEAAQALLGTVYRLTGLNTIQACAHPDNSASIRVLEKLGFTPAGLKLSKPIGREIPIYRIDREGYSTQLE